MITKNVSIGLKTNILVCHQIAETFPRKLLEIFQQTRVDMSLIYCGRFAPRVIGTNNW